MSHKAVILGCNYYIGLSVLRCFGVHNIHTVAVDYSNENAYATHSKYCSERLIAPHYKDDPEGFIRFLENYASKQSVPPVLIPCHDNYVEVIDAHLERLRKSYLISQTEPGIYTKLMNKETLHTVASDHGVLVPETVRVGEDSFYEKVATLLKYPCIVKPVDSPAFSAMFRKKMFKVNDQAELEVALKRAEQAGLEVIVQRIIPGFDDHMYTFDAYLDQQSRVTHWTTCQKYRQYPINFGASVYTEQKIVPELYDIGARFLEDVGFKGFAEIEFKKDAVTGQFYLIEINVRMTNFNTLLHKIGLNMPYLTYLELTGEDIGAKAIDYNTGVVFWSGYEDLLAIKDYIKTKQLTVREIVSSLFKRKACAIWDWRDPKPAIMFNLDLVKRIFRRRKVT